VTFLRRLVAALAALALLTAFAACGDDDDDGDDAATEEVESESEDGGEEEGGEEIDPAMETVCADTGQADDGVITAEEAGEGAAQFEAVTAPPAEIADAIVGAADYLRQLEAAGEDVAVEDTMNSEHLQAVATWCEENMS